MGNSVTCLHPKEVQQRKSLLSRSSSSSSTNKQSRWTSRRRSDRKEDKVDIQNLSDKVIREQAIAAALLFQHHQRSATLPPSFHRSTSVVYPAADKAPPGRHHFNRSSSSRPHSAFDSLLKPTQLISVQDVKSDDVEKQHFVLVHGGGFGAWCWYKTIALLQETGYEVDAVDLTGSGIHSFDTNSITSLAQYVKPLTDFLQNLQHGNKVILVGHDFGGTCVSFAMELFPSKVSKAIFVAATMLTSGQSTLNIFSQQIGSNDLIQRSQKFLYANGKQRPATAIELDKALLRDLFFNESTTKDVALASVSIRPTPFAPTLEELSLSNTNYGSVRRFYIVTLEDCAIPVALQETMINANPPEKVFYLKGADHCPFFSKPQSLHKLLLEVAKIP